MIQSASSLASRFAADRKGNFAVVFAAMSSALILAAGYGVNTAQMFNAKSALDQALDSAITSTARDLTTGKIVEAEARGMVEAFVAANIGAGFGSDVDWRLDSLVVDKTTKTVSAEASIDVALAFPMPGGAQTRRIEGETAAVYSDAKVEVAMMLDITGSMKKTWWNDKIGDLKDAATDAVEDLLDGVDKADPRIRVSIVPYSNAVNVGPDLVRYVHYEKKYTQDPPPAYSDLHLVSLASRKDACATERKGALQFTAEGPYAAMVNRDSRLDFCPQAALKPLTADAVSLVEAIDAFKADGYTAGHIGIQWTWYMLSQKWASVLPAKSAPAKAEAGKVKKIAILMTDGEFNTAFANVKKDANTHDQPVKSQDKAEALCAAMRDDGIEVFTIGFMLDKAAAKATMADCASPDTSGIRHYYDAADGDALAAAFDEIVRNIERLTLTK